MLDVSVRSIPPPHCLGSADFCTDLCGGSPCAFSIPQIRSEAEAMHESCYGDQHDFNVAILMRVSDLALMHNSASCEDECCECLLQHLFTDTENAMSELRVV